MSRLEDLTRGAQVRGVLPDATVTVLDVKWHGSSVAELTYNYKLTELLSRSERPA